MPTSIGVVLGGMMGTLIGALMSGIVGAGLVHPRLKQVVNHLEIGQSVVTICSRDRDEHDRAMHAVQHDSLEVVSNRG